MKGLENIEQKLKMALDEYKEKGFITMAPIYIGVVDPLITAFAASIGKPILNDSIVFRGKEIAHSVRATKREKGINVEYNHFIAFPHEMTRMEIYYDTKTGNYTYTDRADKYIFKPNKIIKVACIQTRAFCLITASSFRKDGNTEFSMDKYIKTK